jgi:phage major head subunit gpT-like protein
MYSESYDVVNQKYESTIEVDRDEISDDQTGQIRLRIREMAERAAQHKDSLLAALLINGHSAGFHSYDGVPFFGATHASGKSGTQDNDISVNVTTPTVPTSADIRLALADAIAQMMGLLDDQAEVMNNAPTGLFMVCPPSMYINALEAVNATIIGSTSNVLQGAARVLPFSRLSAAEVFYLLKTDVQVRPFVFQDREPIEFTAIDKPDDAEVFLREKYLFGVRARYAMTYGYWQRAIKVTFT